jgi:predicted nucleotidyltransferase
VHGSRVFGNPRKNSDIDFILFYKGTIREDDLFNIFVDENIYIEHIKCDFNPIQINDVSDIEYYI